MSRGVLTLVTFVWLFSIVRFLICELPGVALIVLVWFGDLQQLLWPFSMGRVKIFKNLVLQTWSNASKLQELLSEISKPRWSYTMEAKHHRLFKLLVHMVTRKDLNKGNEKQKKTTKVILGEEGRCHVVKNLGLSSPQINCDLHSTELFKAERMQRSGAKWAAMEKMVERVKEKFRCADRRQDCPHTADCRGDCCLFEYCRAIYTFAEICIEPCETKHQFQEMR